MEQLISYNSGRDKVNFEVTGLARVRAEDLRCMDFNSTRKQPTTCIPPQQTPLQAMFTRKAKANTTWKRCSDIIACAIKGLFQDGGQYWSPVAFGMLTFMFPMFTHET